MVFFSYSLGIDFRSRNLIIILLRKFLGKIRMVDYRIYPVWSEGQKDVQEAQWISLISTFLSKNQVKTDRVCISIPREKALVRFLRLPAATKENLRKVIEYEAPKLTPFDKEEFFFDYQIVSEDAEWLNLIVAFVKKEDLNPYLNLLKKVGIHPVFVEVSPVSALNLFHYHQD
ncbi:MAG TPA: pilus assembly protein PilM [Thermodesulfobacteriota bacterium]|nr:pilus assembly protein PilM [Thermodesulfobacteriota bacterium]